MKDGKGILTNGKLRAEIWPDGTLHFFNAADRRYPAGRARADLQQAAGALVSPAQGSDLSKIERTSAPSPASASLAWASTSTACWITRAA